MTAQGAGSKHVPPLGLVPYLPSHNHGVAVPCQEFCPVLEWERHVDRHGNPYAELERLRVANEALEIIAEANANTMRQWEGEAQRLRERAKFFEDSASRYHSALGRLMAFGEGLMASDDEDERGIGCCVCEGARVVRDA